MPGLAPPTPASHDPDVSGFPDRSYSVVSSPRYQTLPSESWAYQSKVSSSSRPSTRTTSRTTVAPTPSTTRLRSVTVTTVRSVPSADFPTKRHVVPTGQGSHGLSMTSTKLEAAGSGCDDGDAADAAEETSEAGVVDEPVEAEGVAEGVAEHAVAPARTVSEATSRSAGVVMTRASAPPAEDVLKVPSAVLADEVSGRLQPRRGTVSGCGSSSSRTTPTSPVRSGAAWRRRATPSTWRATASTGTGSRPRTPTTRSSL